jgi:hypothetical protein
MREGLCERADEASSNLDEFERCPRAPCAGSPVPALPLDDDGAAGTSAGDDEAGGRGLLPGDRLACFARYLQSDALSVLGSEFRV